MANVTITQLPTAGVLTGTELVPVVQNGVTVHTTTAAIAASPSLTQTFLTLNNEPTLANSRYFSVSTGLGLTDNGAQSNLVLSLNGASGSLETAGNGFAVKTGLTTVVGRSLTTSGNGLTVTNGNGAAGNPVFSLTGLPAALSNLSGGGFLVALDPSTILQRSIAGTANEITVADGDGLSGTPTIGLADNAVFPGVEGVTLPAGTTAERAAVPANGTIRYNQDLLSFEGYANNAWGTIVAGVAVTSVDVSGGTTGLTTSGGPITSAGVITLAGTLITTNGGTGLSSYTQGDLIYYNTGTTFNKLAIGSAGQVITSTGTAPQWTNQSSLSVGSATTATNVAGGAANQIVYNTGAATTSFITAPTVANTFLEWSGSAFQWSANPLGTVTSVDVSGGSTGLTTSGGPVTTSGTITLAGTLVVTNGGTGLSTYVAGDTLYYTTGTALSKLSIGSNTYVMTSTGSAPQWTDPATMTVGTATTANSATLATTATNIAGGAAGSIPYQTGSGATAMLATSSGVLVGGTTPSYSTAPSLTGTNFTSIPNGALSNSSITIGTTAISLGASSLTLGGLTSIALTQDPSTALQVATKQYVDGLVTSGITYHTPVKYEVPPSTGNLNAIYSNGTGGVGATLTNNGTLAAFAPDGPIASVNDRILIYNQTNQFENGVYEVTTVGNGSTPWVLTRTADADSYGLKDPNALGNGDAFFVTSGDTGAGELYVCNTAGIITFGTTAITFVQVSSAQVYSAGTGLTLTGTQFSLTTPVVLANGGTGLTTYTAGDLPYFATGTAFSKLAIGATDRILTSSGTAPQWTDPSTITVGSATSATSATTATNVGGGSANQIVFNTAAGTTSFIAAPTIANTFLEWSGSAFQWSVNPLGTVTSVDVSGGSTGLTFTGGPITTSGTITMAGTLAIANGGTNGTATPSAGAIAYGTGTAYAFSAVGNSGDVFTSSGAGAPGWTSQSALSVGSATNATNATNSTNIGITDDTSTNATMYPVWVTANTGSLPAKVTSTKLSFNPSTGVLTATGGISGGTF